MMVDTHPIDANLVARSSRATYVSNLLLWMGKGDGKKKRKKKSKPASGGGNAASSSAHEPQPLRVTSNSNIPVRHQLKWAKLNKEYRQQSSPGFRQKRVERTSYRRTWDEEEIEEKAELRRRKGQDPDWDIILSRCAIKPLVMVDGYNIIHSWARLKKHMTRGDLAKARQLLLDDLENLSSLKGWRIEVVFDGTARKTAGPLGTTGKSGSGDKPTAMDKASATLVSKHGVRVVYSGVGMEADAYIESRCMEAKNVTGGDLTGSLIVATDDAMIRMAGVNAGALCMSADRFVNELKAVKKSMNYRVEVAMAKVNGQAVRPEKLWGTAMVSRPGRNKLIIEDKRNRTNTRRKKHTLPEDYNYTAVVDGEEDEDGIPYWAKLPNTTSFKR